MFWKPAVALLVLGAVPLASVHGHYAVTGVYVDPRAGSVPYRQNINELQAAGGAQWDLYIQALTAMHEADASDQLSYFQISGIHGKPFMDWDDSGGENTNGWAGYCPHGEKLFLPWHRPFVLAYEQVLVDHAKQLAQGYPERYRYEYEQAAETLRAPFWDWASESYVPQVTVPTTLRINVADGEVLKPMDIDNPLATFIFPRAALNGTFGEFDSENRTRIYRCPSPQSYPDSANANLASRPYQQWIYDAFTRSDNFSEFASTGDDGVSLEQAHNGIHWDAACAGQFLSTEFSAFDPLFMLHHCNVDRLWAYWQAVNPDQAIFNSSYSGGSRFSTPQGTDIYPSSPLQPFHNSTGDFHTSLSVTSIEDLGYTYLELEYWQKSPQEMTQNAKQLINRLYYANDTTATRLMRRQEQTTRYFVKIALEVSEVDRPCSINVHVGSRQAGSFPVMQQPTSGLVHGSLALDGALGMPGRMQASTAATLSTIQTSLEAEIITRDGRSIPLKTVPSLKVEVEDVQVTAPQADDEFPRYSIPRRREVMVGQRAGSAVH